MVPSWIRFPCAMTGALQADILKKYRVASGVPFVAQLATNLTRIHEVLPIPGLAQLVKDPVLL